MFYLLRKAAWRVLAGFIYVWKWEEITKNEMKKERKHRAPRKPKAWEVNVEKNQKYKIKREENKDGESHPFFLDKKLFTSFKEKEEACLKFGTRFSHGTVCLFSFPLSQFLFLLGLTPCGLILRTFPLPRQQPPFSLHRNYLHLLDCVCPFLYYSFVSFNIVWFQFEWFSLANLESWIEYPPKVFLGETASIVVCWFYSALLHFTLIYNFFLISHKIHFNTTPFIFTTTTTLSWISSPAYS
jgi:hypothetical protein